MSLLLRMLSLISISPTSIIIRWLWTLMTIVILIMLIICSNHLVHFLIRLIAIQEILLSIWLYYRVTMLIETHLSTTKSFSTWDSYRWIAVAWVESSIINWVIRGFTCTLLKYKVIADLLLLLYIIVMLLRLNACSWVLKLFIIINYTLLIMNRCMILSHIQTTLR